MIARGQVAIPINAGRPHNILRVNAGTDRRSVSGDDGDVFFAGVFDPARDARVAKSQW